MKDLLQSMIPVFAVIATALLTYFLGLHAYFRQKEYESARERYLDKTLDLFVAHVEHCLAVYRMNWHTSLALLKAYRDYGAKTPVTDIHSRVHHVDHANLRISAAYRLGILLNGNTTFYNMQQLLVAFVERSSAFLEDELIGAIRLTVDGTIKDSDVDDLYGKCLARIKEMHAESKVFYVLLTESASLAYLFERKRLSFATLHRFVEDKDGQASLQNLSHALALLLKEHSIPAVPGGDIEEPTKPLYAHCRCGGRPPRRKASSEIAQQPDCGQAAARP